MIGDFRVILLETLEEGWVGIFLFFAPIPEGLRGKVEESEKVLLRRKRRLDEIFLSEPLF